MAYSIVQQDNDISYGVMQYVTNTRAEALAIPKDCLPGSTVFIINESAVLMLTVDDETENREWKEI